MVTHTHTHTSEDSEQLVRTVVAEDLADLSDSSENGHTHTHTHTHTHSQYQIVIQIVNRLKLTSGQLYQIQERICPIPMTLRVVRIVCGYLFLVVRIHNYA